NQHCKCPEVECEECPEWIFTLADLIMCMMGLFVILWVLKEGGATSAETMTDKEKEVVAAIRDAFGYEPDPTSNDPIDAYIILKRLEQMKSRKGEGEGGETKIRRDGAEG